MKKILMITMGLLMIMTFVPGAKAQEEEKASSWNAGLDIYSSYIWRGSKFGTGPAIQPSVKFTTGGLTIGVWGSFDAAGYAETDPYISYSFPFGLSIGVTDYYYPTLGGSFFSDSSHAAEINLGYTFKSLSFSANYILNEAPVPASSGADLYFQAGYAFENFNISIGAGNGWHTSDTEFNICHVTIGTTKTIEITDKFSIPVSGSVVLNPDKEQLFVVVGISL
ncbi:MAG: hypothetical protein FD181_797 [Prolixibacteraceae bacterium]|nr:MAG: hypothetical protein FD181_797 [Prolixibacteraceae bacterium]